MGPIPSVAYTDPSTMKYIRDREKTFISLYIYNARKMKHKEKAKHRASWMQVASLREEVKGESES